MVTHWRNRKPGIVGSNQCGSQPARGVCAADWWATGACPLAGRVTEHPSQGEVEPCHPSPLSDATVTRLGALRLAQTESGHLWTADRRGGE